MYLLSIYWEMLRTIGAILVSPEFGILAMLLLTFVFIDMFLNAIGYDL